MRLYSYVMSHDTGCAPRFERGLLVLSGCRDDICKKAQPGDYVMGIGRITLGYPEPVLVYIGRVKKRGNSTEPRLVFDKDESYYFGVKAPVIPDGLKYWRVPVRHRFNFSADTIRKFLRFARQRYDGIPGGPHEKKVCRRKKPPCKRPRTTRCRKR
jgi:hypothetical protein